MLKSTLIIVPYDESKLTTILSTIGIFLPVIDYVGDVFNIDRAHIHFQMNPFVEVYYPT